MARKRQQTKSAFDNVSKEELQNVGKNILKKASGETEEPKEKNKLIYVPASIHQKAKIQAAQSGMTIKKYISYLIEKDGEQ